MTVELLLKLLGWCAIINIGLLAFWLLMFVLMHDFIYRLHTKWFAITPERFDTIHYSGMAIFKMLILFFNLVPYLAIRIVS